MGTRTIEFDANGEVKSLELNDFDRSIIGAKTSLVCANGVMFERPLNFVEIQFLREFSDFCTSPVTTINYRTTALGRVQCLIEGVVVLPGVGSDQFSAFANAVENWNASKNRNRLRSLILTEANFYQPKESKRIYSKEKINVKF